MSDVVAFRPAQSTPPSRHVRLSAGTVTTSTEPADVGRFLYFLTFVDGQGGELDVWDGPGRQDALTAAREWQRDGVPLIDETAPAVTQ